MKKKKIKFLTSRLLVKIFATVSVMAIMAGVFMLGIQSPIYENVFYRVAPGATISAVARDLKSKDLIVHERLFKISVMFQGNRIQSGEYELPRGATISRIAKMLNRGKIASTTIIIPEGLTVKQIKKQLLENPILSGPVECVATTDNAQQRPVCNLQDGDLFPDTYRVPRGMDRLAVLELARKKMESVRMGWEKSGRPIPAPLKSWNDVVTLASIVQKETPQASEMPTVASVYMNRLKKKMRLQADPTVVYAITDGLGDMGGNPLYSNHLKTNSPYNTYTNYGLPPAPIANVGRNAIAAVLNPADTNYLFFVADGTGGHRFSRSYEEHKKYHADWRQIKKSVNSRK